MYDELDARRRADQFGALTGGGRASRAEENHPRARALALIEQLSFQVAKSTPHIPHEYTVRDKNDPMREWAYIELFHLIQADGMIERRGSRKIRHLYPGDGYKYWAMVTLEPTSRVLNRMRVEDDRRRCAPSRNRDYPCGSDEHGRQKAVPFRDS